MPQFFPLLSEGIETANMYNQSHCGVETVNVLATSGTITTSGPPATGLVRLQPAAAVTAVVLQTGTVTGQQCWLVNESAQANTVTFAASGTSNVADGTSDVIQGLQGRLYVWDDGTSLWYATPQLVTITGFTQSASAAATATSGTITTSGVQVARISPTSAITAVVMQTGTAAGQICMVVNEAAATNIASMAASGTSNVADGVNCVIPGLSTQIFAWDSGTSLWYEVSPTKSGGSPVDIQSATAPATATSGTITSAGVGVARVSPTSAITAVVLGTGTIAGQRLVIVNESTTGANTVTFAASGTSNVADGVTTVISGLRCATYVWDSSTSLWYHS